MSEEGHPVVARLYDPVMAVPERTVLVEHRENLVSELSGRVLDLGAGTGALFPYFDRLEASDLQVTAVEPDPHMRARARKRAIELDVDIEVVDASGEALPYDDGRFDVVVASFVFCTIPDHRRAFDEVARVLEDGGEFRFVEHIRGDGVAGRTHDLLAPCWHTVAGGCNLNRRTNRLFLEDDRFRTLKYERQQGLTSKLLPIIRGRLERKRRPFVTRVCNTLG